VLVDFLCANKDIFVWKPSDMPIIHREVSEHALNIKPGSCLVKQRLYCFEQTFAVEAYVDDIVVKTKQADQLVADLEQTFARLHANRVRLNPKKMSFGVPRGMLLGFIISQ